MAPLVRQIEYLRVENQILRSNLGRRVNVTPSERRRLIKFGLALKSDIRNLMSIVSYSTFRRWHMLAEISTFTPLYPSRHRSLRIVPPEHLP